MSKNIKVHIIVISIIFIVSFICTIIYTCSDLPGGTVSINTSIILKTAIGPNNSDKFESYEYNAEVYEILENGERIPTGIIEISGKVN
ncbi:hypothetical protein FACS1894132_03760 [Clostridia bacterium]|nr:hypothetical protein FACS1894132_03760 [Clostridia bacterium]